MQCARCGADNSANARFCNQCGNGLDGQPGDTPAYLAERIVAAQAAAGGAGGERKIISALFADIAESTSLVQALDPEEARNLLDPVLALMMEAVHHYEGYVAKSLGDGILALFGAPIAHEDHPQRALFAALRMQHRMRRHGKQAVQIRVGIHTAEVVVRSLHTQDLRTDYDPVGPAIHLAHRLEGLAAPGSIVVSEATRRGGEGYFEFRALGAFRVKGFVEPVAAFEVMGLGPSRTRFQLAALRGLVPFVGRQPEIATLDEGLARARAGEGQVIGVVGEPGVGKSRLFHEFRQHIAPDCRVLETSSVSHGKAFAYLPLIELLKHYLQLGSKGTQDQRRDQIRARVLAGDRSLEDTVPYLFHLLGLLDADAAVLHMDPRLRRQRIFDAVRRLLVGASLAQPLVVIFEDLQWLDRETSGFVQYLAESIAGARLLVLVNYRPEYRHDWERWRHYTQLNLEPLAGGEAGALLGALLGDGPDLAQVKPLVMAQTQGNPFFVEEVVHKLVEEQVLCGEQGHYHLARAPQALQIPATVQGVLAARIDRLPLAEKALLQTLAVVGKAFAWSLVQRVVEGADDTLRALLSRLEARAFLCQRPAFPEVEFSFRHSLTQEVAYGSLLLERRRTLHEQTARALEALFDGQLDAHSNELAYHYRRSQNAPKAVEYLYRAGQQAALKGADHEAIDQLKVALELLEALPDTPSRTRRELAIQLALGPSLMAVRGYGATEVADAYRRALALQRQVGETTDLFFALAGLRIYYQVRADHRVAQELGERMLSMAERTGDADLLLEAHCALGSFRLFLGELGPARRHLDRAIALYDRQRHHLHARRYGLDPGVWSRYLLGIALALRGDRAGAQQCMDAALELARDLEHPFSLTVALCFSAQMHRLLQQPEQVQQQADAAIELAGEHGFSLWLSFARVLQGWALAASTAGRDGLAQIRTGLADFRATGAQMLLSHLTTLLADALYRGGQQGAAQSVVQDALALGERHREPVFEAELYHLQAELLARAPEPGKACEESFRRAIATARDQGAHLLELRAALGLGRLLLRLGRGREIAGLLAPVCQDYPADPACAELRQARRLMSLKAER